MDQSLFTKYQNIEFKKAPKNSERLRLIDRLSEVTGRSKKSVHFSTLKWPDSWLLDALNHCEPYSNPKMRNKMFGEFVAATKVKNG